MEESSDENNNTCEPKKYDPDDPEEPNLSASEVGRRWWRQYLKRDNSVLSDLFMGQFRSTLKCTVCSHESVTFEPFWLISVPIPSKGRSRGSAPEGTIKLQDCLDLYVAGMQNALTTITQIIGFTLNFFLAPTRSNVAEINRYGGSEQNLTNGHFDMQINWNCRSFFNWNIIGNQQKLRKDLLYLYKSSRISLIHFNY